jgi:hypothetical protein
MPIALAARRWSALTRGAGTFVVAAVWPPLTVLGYLWFGAIVAIVIATIGFFTSALALAALYYMSRPLRIKGVPMALGFIALLALFFVGVTASRDIAMTLVGTEDEAVVVKTWTTVSRGFEQHHCTVRHLDGTPIPRRLDTSCEGREPGDTIPVVLDSRGRLAPVGGTKDDLSAAGELRVLALAGLVLAAAIAIGSPPKRR